MLDIEIHLNILELIHSAAGGEGVEVLFRVLSGHSEGSELVVNVNQQSQLSPLEQTGAACISLGRGY